MADEMERLCSGVDGVDELIEGGYPYPSVILVAGPAGTGKTTFTQQFLFAGAEMGEIGLYFTTLSEPPQWVMHYMSNFKHLNKSHIGKNVIFCDIGQMLRKASPEEILAFIDEEVARTMAQRVVIDPITVIKEFLGNDYRPFLFDLVNHLKNWRAVSILTGEVEPNQLYPSEVAYASDGVVLLTYEEVEGARRKYMEVLKMRGTNHRTGKQSFVITKEDGFVVLSGTF
ncbi:MAG: KaiA-binding protein [Candidatus Thermoplasmatota archaeon]|nr:KaiA-binding protein [Euryarchaeota archaeon]MBU4031598.1 KaiA-binding protein [Candidatus Thermoplasmatota archaeon]MBU4071041.1 KaiA-binding protein [Candidatus Thermoplasmatota archaeon]MBU4145124.1 KaiA-binding protein [Candidatus Thermoplasmatota archaeon]MBU4591030.1 KaiA-binding protein [Candidatus Thermoplasmatota archaeon]